MATPTWLTICWNAPAMPRSCSSTALAMAVDIAGDAEPMPRPDRATAKMMNKSRDAASTWERASIDSVIEVAPNIAARRSPTRMVR